MERFDRVAKTNLGKISLILIVLMPVLFLSGSLLSTGLYANVPAGNSVLEDLALRPLLAVSMLLALVSGFAAFGTGFFAIARKKEDSGLVYAATIVGALLIIFLIGELVFSH